MIYTNSREHDVRSEVVLTDKPSSANRRLGPRRVTDVKDGAALVFGRLDQDVYKILLDIVNTD